MNKCQLVVAMMVVAILWLGSVQLEASLLKSDPHISIPPCPMCPECPKPVACPAPAACPSCPSFSCPACPSCNFTTICHPNRDEEEPWWKTVIDFIKGILSISIPISAKQSINATEALAQLPKEWNNYLLKVANTLRNTTEDNRKEL